MKTKDQIIDEVLSTDKGIEDIAEAATCNIVDISVRQTRKAEMIALLNMSRAGIQLLKKGW